MNKSTAAHHRRYARAIEGGYCRKCGNRSQPMTPSYVTCDRCREGARLLRAEYRNTHRAALTEERRRYKRPYRHLIDTTRCALCEFSAIVHVHHIDRNHTNNTPSNLIALCPNHHALVTHGLLTL